MIVAYFMLAISIVAEVIAASFITATKGFTKLKTSIVCFCGYLLSYGCFGYALVKINLGIAYATWGAVGIVVTAIVGYLYYKQKMTKIGYISLLVIIISTITLNLFGQA